MEVGVDDCASAARSNVISQGLTPIARTPRNAWFEPAPREALIGGSLAVC
jgi:hypothetical protein